MGVRRIDRAREAEGEEGTQPGQRVRARRMEVDKKIQYVE
jgi:hypothetical protein